MEKDNLEFLKEHKPTLIGLPEARKAAVCIPLIETDEGWDILFEVRAADIESQPGDICFPGGGLEEGETTAQAAVREMTEELLVSRDQIEMLGLLDVFGGGSGMLYVYPYAVILSGYKGTFSPAEVERVFRVPLAWFCENGPEVYHTSMQVIPGEGFPYDRIHDGRGYTWRKRSDEVLFYQYGDETIWGMTAKILNAFIKIYKEESGAGPVQGRDESE